MKGSNNIVDIVLARDKKMSVEKLKVLETKKGDQWDIMRSLVIIQELIN